MKNFLCGGMFQAMWNNFYNAIVRNASSTLKGVIILVISTLLLLFLLSAIKKVDSKGEKPMIQNWFAFWMAMVCLVLLIIYIVMISA